MHIKSLQEMKMSLNIFMDIVNNQIKNAEKEFLGIPFDVFFETPEKKILKWDFKEKRIMLDGRNVIELPFSERVEIVCFIERLENAAINLIDEFLKKHKG